MAGSQVSKAALRARFVGKSLHEVGTPAVVLDLAKLEANCNLMLEAVERLGLGWRCHIKTHKTIELARLQVGDKSTTPVNLMVSTVLEAENIVPLLKEYKKAGRKVNVLYAFPLLGSYVDRLARVSAQLGRDGLSVLVDHADQLPHLAALAEKSGGGNRPAVFLKIDMGYGRAGVVPGSPECGHLADELLRAESAGGCTFLGLYCHAGHSYATRKDWEAMGLLGDEFGALQRVARGLRRPANSRPLVLSVGATPTATAIQHPDLDPASASSSSSSGSSDAATPAARVKSLIADLKADGFLVEVHAGVYPTLDLQQLATHSRDAARQLTASAIGISLLAEVASVYPGRGPGGSTQALVNAGTLALGREPCQDLGEVPGRHYAGWGVVAPWNTGNPAPGPGFPAEHGGWQVVKISQEHGILGWVGGEEEIPLRVGQRVRIWPNHACVAGAGHGWYLVVDSRNEGREDEIVDAWPRWNGW
ncbi:hypothetical protein DL771_010158 [Monosporascus sp. 5C6A]|nr:hypothetical protein DL771_010158 [Monosporascus sp. 5C6A]